MSASASQLRHHQLRSTTAQSHARLDELFPQGLATLDDYRHYLVGMHRLCADVEAAWLAAAAPPAIPEAVSRRRLLLGEDLATHGLTPLPPGPPLTLGNAAELAGAEYVVQGSRRGGRLLLRQAKTLVGESRAHGFLQWHARDEGEQQWQALLGSLATIVVTAQDEQDLMAGAIRTFAAAAHAFELARRIEPVT